MSIIVPQILSGEERGVVMSQEQQESFPGAAHGDRTDRLRVSLGNINKTLLRAHSKEDLLQNICDLLVNLAGFPIIWIGWLNPKTMSVVAAASAGERAGGYLQMIKVTANGREEGQGPTGFAIREGGSLVCNDFLADQRTRPWHDAARKAGIRSSAAFPFTCGTAKVCGTINVYSDEVGAFSDADVALLEEVAANLSFRLAELDEIERREKSKIEAGKEGELFRKFAEASGSVFWIMSVHPELILYVNSAFERIWGIAVSELYRNPRLWTDSIHLDDRPRILESFSNWIEGIPGSEYNVNYRIIRPDGRMRWIHDTGFTLLHENGERWNYAGIAQDVTERVMAEEDLRTSRERYKNILDNMMEGCMIIGFDWNYLYVNDAAARHGYQERENLVGRSMLSAYPEVEKSTVFSYYKRCMEQRVPQRFESSYTFEDGTTNWYEFRVAPVPEGIFILSLDISDRVRAGQATGKSRGRV